MNITDVDDKTIRDSKDNDTDPMKALLAFTRKYEQVFMDDMAKIGNDLSSMEFIRATDSIEEMLDLIVELYENEIAYIADDGVYFSIAEYKKRGRTYGQLVHIDESSTSASRIQNDEYDKESAHDFALWKIAKEGEPSWAFELDGHTLDGRPGWHIECSAMSRKLLGQPFDIHTGGIDLKFPHHENEIAQSTACVKDQTMAKVFVHNEHVLVDGKKMSKSLGNVYLIGDLEGKRYLNAEFSAQDYRHLVLSSHYRKQTEFTIGNLYNSNRLNRTFYIFRDILHQIEPNDLHPDAKRINMDDLELYYSNILEHLTNDLNTHMALAELSNIVGYLFTHYLTTDLKDDYILLIERIENLLGLSFYKNINPRILEDIKKYRKLYLAAREKNTPEAYAESDSLRRELADNTEDPINLSYNKNLGLFSWHRYSYSQASTLMRGSGSIVADVSVL
jgi:cysteinyl-tRNA synthetase